MNYPTLTKEKPDYVLLCVPQMVRTIKYFAEI